MKYCAFEVPTSSWVKRISSMKKNGRSWLQKIEKYSTVQTTELNDHDNIKFIISYVTGDYLKWRELQCLRRTSLKFFPTSKKKYSDILSRSIKNSTLENVQIVSGKYASTEISRYVTSSSPNGHSKFQQYLQKSRYFTTIRFWDLPESSGRKSRIANM